MLLKQVKDGRRGPWCISYLSLRHAQLRGLLRSGHSEAIRMVLSTPPLSLLLLANLGSHTINVLVPNPTSLNNSLSPHLLSPRCRIIGSTLQRVFHPRGLPSSRLPPSLAYLHARSERFCEPLLLPGSLIHLQVDATLMARHLPVLGYFFLIVVKYILPFYILPI